MFPPMFFDDWQGLVRVIVVGLLAYGALIGMLRLSGKRTLGKLNAFDLVVTVALGSTLATILLNADVPLVEGVAAFALLIALQYILTWLAVRSEAVENLIKSEPTLLVHDGQYLTKAMRGQRVTRPEIAAALRASGKDDLASIASVVLETDGSMTVIPRDGG